MSSTSFPTRFSHVPLKQLQQRVRERVGQRIDWLRIYVVNEEEILLAGACPSGSTRQRVVDAVRKAAPAARLRSAIVVNELAPGLRPAPVSTRRSGR